MALFFCAVPEECYLQWCGENNIDNPAMKWLCRNLKTILPKLREERRQTSGSRERHYFGIGLLDENSVVDEPAPSPFVAEEVLTEAQANEFFTNLLR
jgi:hypothetical protein